MIEINTQEVLREAAHKYKIKPPAPTIEIEIVNGEDVQTVTDEVPVDKSNALLQQLWVEFKDTKIARAKLSSATWRLVANGASQQVLKDHYAKIESFRPVLQDLYDKIDHVERTGSLPATVVDVDKPKEDIYYLRDRKKALINQRHKLRQKLAASAKPRDPNRVLLWETTLEQLDAEYFEVDQRIKKLSGKA